MSGQETMGQGASVYRSYIFLLSGDGQILPIPHSRYVAMVRGEEAMPQFTNQVIRLADWYVEVRNGEIGRIDNETYGYLEFDNLGYACPPCGNRPGQPERWQPNEAEWQAMRHLLGTVSN